MIRTLFQATAVRCFPATHWKRIAASQQNDKESQLLEKYTQKFNCHQSFVEFGFHAFQYNSVSLTKRNFQGLLLDADQRNCDLASLIFKRLRLNTSAICTWITRDTLSPIFDFVRRIGGELGVLNVDIDGNDYWILKELLSGFRPAIICTEHNASFGLRPITIPYSDDFDRHKHHASGLYHGASISAFFKLLSDDYALIENIEGLNLIFARKDKLTSDVRTFVPEEAYMEHHLRNEWSKMNSTGQWQTIKDLPFVAV